MQNLVDENLGSYIDARDFEGASSIRLFEAPRDLYGIGSFAFANSSVSVVNLNKNLNTLGKYIFKDCKDLSVLIFDKECKVEEIPEGLCYRCNSLIEVVLPNSLTRINAKAFAGCTELVNIVIPDSVKYIDSGAFAGCHNLGMLKMPDGCEVHSNAFGFEDMIKGTVDVATGRLVESEVGADDIGTNGAGTLYRKGNEGVGKKKESGYKWLDAILSRPTEYFTPMCKKEHEIEIIKPSPNWTTVYNRFTDVEEVIKDDDVVIRGTAGELYTMPLNEAIQVYNIDANDLENSNGNSVTVRVQSDFNGAPTLFGFRVTKDLETSITDRSGNVVSVNKDLNSHNEMIDHDAGDFIICGAKEVHKGVYAPDVANGFRVVNGVVAKRTLCYIGLIQGTPIDI